MSAKLGTGVPHLLDSIIERFPCPQGDPTAPLRMLLFDSWYNQYRGVVCLVTIVDGILKKGSFVTYRSDMCVVCVICVVTYDVCE